MESRMQLVLSFDIENKYDSKTDLITADNVPGKPGTRWIMDRLEQYGQTGVFFVNVYEHKAYADNFFPDLLQEIRDRGHEAALHMHHESMVEEKRLNDYRNLTLTHKEDLIAFGVDYFVKHIGMPPDSYRAGAYIIDEETFDVLERAGIRVDSSLCFGYNLPGTSWFSNKNMVSEYQHIQLPHLIRPKLWEVPVTTVGRVNQYRNLSMDHFHQAALKSALAQMAAHKIPMAVMVGHSFSFLKFGESKTEVLGADPAQMLSFESLLQFVSAASDIETTTFSRQLEHGMPVASESGSFVPQVEKRWIGRKLWGTLKDNSSLLKDDNVAPNKGKVVWLHIGTWKTGTTSIQRFLRNNVNWLKQNDYYLPTQDGLLNAPTAKNLCNHSPIISGDMEILTVLKEAILKTKARNIILTSENIGYANPEQVRHLRVALAGCDVRVVVYLRRQDQYTQSLYGQHIRGGNKTTLVFEEHLKKHYRKYEYDKLLSVFSDIFGQKNIIVRPYEKQQWWNENLIEDFARCIELPPFSDQIKTSIASTNFPFSIPALQVIREANSHALKNRPLLIKLLGQYSKENDNLSMFHTHNWVSGKRQLELIKEFELGNISVAKKYLDRSDGALFKEPLPDVNLKHVSDEELQREIAKIALYLWNSRAK